MRAIIHPVRSMMDPERKRFIIDLVEEKSAVFNSVTERIDLSLLGGGEEVVATYEVDSINADDLPLRWLLGFNSRNKWIVGIIAVILSIIVLAFALVF